MNMQDYWHENYKVGSFGIDYLDRKLNGIAKSDLTLIGARSGSGKSSIANRIYSINNKNIKCTLFSLENFDGDLYSQNVYLKYKKSALSQQKLDKLYLNEYVNTINEDSSGEYIIINLKSSLFNNVNMSEIDKILEGWRANNGMYI